MHASGSETFAISERTILLVDITRFSGGTTVKENVSGHGCHCTPKISIESSR